MVAECLADGKARSRPAADQPAALRMVKRIRAAARARGARAAARITPDGTAYKVIVTVTREEP